MTPFESKFQAIHEDWFRKLIQDFSRTEDFRDWLHLRIYEFTVSQDLNVFNTQETLWKMVTLNQLTPKDVFVLVQFLTSDVNSNSIEEIFKSLEKLLNITNSNNTTISQKYDSMSLSNGEIENYNFFVEKSDIKGYLLNIQEESLTIVLDHQVKSEIQLKLSTLHSDIKQLINKITKITEFPIPVYFLGIQIINGDWIIDHLIIYPDYLVDVTSIASCYELENSTSLRYLINLFKYAPASKYMLIGTAVNEFLDELLINPEAKYNDLVSIFFKKYPFAISLLGEAEVKDFLELTEHHFNNLKLFIHGTLNQIISPGDIFQLEPSYFSVKFGIQGRLDVLIESDKNERKIIELKSGKPYNTNSFGINPNHAAQTQLYELLIQSAHGLNDKTSCYLLYSSQQLNPLRISPPDARMNRELLNIRNSIVLIHLNLAYNDPEGLSLLDQIQLDHFNSVNQFLKRDGTHWLQSWIDLDPVSQSYLRNYIQFIAREQLISKLGSGMNNNSGMSALWNLSISEKKKAFQSINYLRIINIYNHELDNPIVELSLEDQDYGVSVFREGDTLVLFQDHPSGQGALFHQIYKCTLIEIDETSIKVRLRGRQFKVNSNGISSLWNLEPDILDRSYLYQYESLFQWAESPYHFRKKFLGLIPSDTGLNNTSELLENEIDNVVSKALLASDYYLIWGPPGSGKTSVVIKSLIQNTIINTSENILLLAYTNRAVDEICEAITSLNDEEIFQFLRIGSRFGSHHKFHSSLLDVKLRNVENRRDLRKMLKKHRIFCATIASIHGKKEIFDLINFDTVIIDEASQILEPNLCGLLSKFKKYILIGDHMQLPAVCFQNNSNSKIVNSELNEIGFKSKSQSLFERMYLHCQKKQWNHSFSMLTKQGRMHIDIMRLPSQLFYEGKLEPMFTDQNHRQTQSLQYRYKELSKDIPPEYYKYRCIFYPVKDDDSGSFSKTHEFELQAIMDIVQNIKLLYKQNGIHWSENSLGIISPFRAQNSAIARVLRQAGLNSENQIKIDTVERFQGSARDIIIFSLCAHSVEQLGLMNSSSDDGVNRKLNVALTRAREQIFVIGNPGIMDHYPEYKALMSEYHWLNKKD